MKIIRVFPRRTSYTPKDNLVFIGEPPLERLEADEVHVSVTFTWDKPHGERLAETWAQYYPNIQLGGPAYNSPALDFVLGRYVKTGVVFTSRGCEHHCPWCLVPLREGPLHLLPIQPGWVIQDNSFLQTPHEHQKNVFDMLRSQKKAVEFPGGLETRLIDSWIVAQLKTLRLSQIFLAADSVGALKPLEQAVKLLALPRRKVRCYVLIGFNEEGISQAEERLRMVWEAGALPFAQLFQPPDKYIKWPYEWRQLARTWSRPAAMFALMGEGPDKSGPETLFGPPPGAATLSPPRHRPCPEANNRPLRRIERRGQPWTAPDSPGKEANPEEPGPFETV